MPALDGLHEEILRLGSSNTTDRELALMALQLIAESNTAADLAWMLSCGKLSLVQHRTWICNYAFGANWEPDQS